MTDNGSDADKRLDAFVDAAFAFAVTLLIIAGAEPLRSVGGLTEALRRIPAFAVGFAFVVMFWSAHRSYGSLTHGRGGAATLISLAIVFTILVYVFPLRLLTETGVGWLTGGLLPGRKVISRLSDLGAVFIASGLGFSVLAGLFAALNHVGRLYAAEQSAALKLCHARNAWILCCVVGLISVGLAASPLLSFAPWSPGIAYWLIPIGLGYLHYAHHRQAGSKSDR